MVLARGSVNDLLELISTSRDSAKVLSNTGGISIFCTHMGTENRQVNNVSVVSLLPTVNIAESMPLSRYPGVQSKV